MPIDLNRRNAQLQMVREAQDEIEAARSLLESVERKARQLGDAPSERMLSAQREDLRRLRDYLARMAYEWGLYDAGVGDMDDWPADLRVREMPRGAGEAQ